MTVSQINSTSNYIGLSTDTKPRVEVGSTFYETDTQRSFVINEIGAWTRSESVPTEYGLEVAAGRVPDTSIVHKFGRNPSVSTQEDIWDVGGLWVPPTAARTHQIVSSSANDAGSVLSSGTIDTGSTTQIVDNDATFSSDGVAAGDTVISDENYAHATITGVTETTLTLSTARHNRPFVAGNTYRVVTPTSTGASIVHVKGLDANMLAQDEFIVTNGQTNVPTVNTYYRINRMHLDGANGRVANIGNITATADTDGTVSAQISAGRGQTLMAIDTIPSNKVGFLHSWSTHINRSGGAGALADMSLLEVPFADVGGSGIRLEAWSGISVDAPDHEDFDPPLMIDPNTDLIVRCEGVSATGDVTARFELVLQDLEGDTGG